MPERWQVELRKLKEMQPPGDLWDRVMLGPRPATQGKPRPRWIGWVAPLAAGAAVMAAVGVAATISGAIHGSGRAGDSPASATVYAVYNPALVKPFKLTPGVIIPLRAGTARPPIRVRGLSGAVITPDGKTIYAATYDGIVPIGTATGTPGKLIRVSRGAAAQIVISPNGKIAYGTSILPFGKIILIDLATNTVGKPIRVSGGGDRIAFAPDGKTAYVLKSVPRGSGTVTPINTATSTVGKPIRVGPGFDQIAFTPDGRTAYVAGLNTVTPISTATGTPGTPIRIHGSSVSIAVTPDGKTVYVGISAAPACEVVPISTATNTVGTPIRLGSRAPEDMAITPDGKTVYIANAEGPPGAVVPISTATNTAGKPIGVGLSAEIGITPDGKTLYAAAWKSPGQPRIVAISTATNTPGKPIVLPIRVSLPYGVITP